MSDVISLLRESGAMLEGHFLLSSGRHSDKYFQCAKLLQYPNRAAEALSGVRDRLKHYWLNEESMPVHQPVIDAVAGPALGGIVVAYELARQLGVPAIFTERNDSGEMTLRRGFEVKQGERFLVVEDVITTGKSALECANVLQAHGATIVNYACIVDRSEPGALSPYTVYSACRIPAESWVPESCELCRQGVPLVKPGSRKI
jgi:orotate phosphoribosyltransferase